MLVPLIIYPYLIRVLGKETYGLVVFVQAIVAYLVILVEFGFNTSATREISLHRNNKEKLNEIVSSVLIIKSVHFLLVSLLMGLLIRVIPKAHGYELLFVLSMWTCLYEVIFPTWYFQGIEQMKYITYITLISRLIFLGLIFVFIKSPSDYLFVPLINGIGALVAGLIALFIILGKQKIVFEWQPFSKLKYYFFNSVPLFFSNLFISIYTSTNKVIVGFFLGLEEVAYYDLAEKVTTALKVPQNILSQSLFPKNSKDRDIGFIKRVFKLSVIFHVALFLLVLLFSKPIILVLGGEQMLPARTILIILALTVPVIAMSNIFGIQVLIAFGYNKVFSRVIMISVLAYLVQLLPLWIITGFSTVGISVVTLITEIFVCVSLFYYCKKLNLWPQKRTI